MFSLLFVFKHNVQAFISEVQWKAVALAGVEHPFHAGKHLTKHEQQVGVERGFSLTGAVPPS